MNTPETILIITGSEAFAFACLAVAREAIKRPWIKFSWSASVSILPPEKRQPAATTYAAGAAAGTSPAVPADPAKPLAPAA